MQRSVIDPDKYIWKEVNGPTDSPYLIHQQWTLLGYNRDAGVFDMIIRFDDQGGGCPAHRHICQTRVLVLEGEQHLQDMLPDGSRASKVRKSGDYHLTMGDIHPHLERGGPNGALVLYSHHAPDGRMYELVDLDGRVTETVTIDSMLKAWAQR